MATARERLIGKPNRPCRRFNPAVKGGNASYDVFVSYSRSEEVAAEGLNGWLRTHRVSTFYDRSELRSGLRWISPLKTRSTVPAR
jgi:hypothetical protein